MQNRVNFHADKMLNSVFEHIKDLYEFTNNFIFIKQTLYLTLL